MGGIEVKKHGCKKTKEDHQERKKRKREVRKNKNEGGKGSECRREDDKK